MRVADGWHMSSVHLVYCLCWIWDLLSVSQIFEKGLVYLQLMLSRVQLQIPSKQPHHLLPRVVKPFPDRKGSQTTISNSAFNPVEVKWLLSSNRCYRLILGFSRVRPLRFCHRSVLDCTFSHMIKSIHSPFSNLWDTLCSLSLNLLEGSVLSFLT